MVRGVYEAYTTRERCATKINIGKRLYKQNDATPTMIPIFCAAVQRRQNNYLHWMFIKTIPKIVFENENVDFNMLVQMSLWGMYEIFGLVTSS